MSAIASMPSNLRPADRSAQVPTCAADALVGELIRERRQEVEAWMVVDIREWNGTASKAVTQHQNKEAF